jgi:hypothetical protein
MESRITHFSLVFRFLDIDFNSNEISALVNHELQDILNNSLDNLPENWILIFNATYSNSYKLLISKNRFGTSFKDRIKEIKIVIPIPLKSEVSWGVESDQQLYKRDNYDSLIKKNLVLEVDYSKFLSRKDYIIDCLRRGIELSLKVGITIDGMKIKIPE